MATIEQQYKLPDGKGGENVYHFETSDNQVLMADGRKLAESFNALHARLKKLIAYNTLPTKNDIKSILKGTYSPVGGDGEGESNGVPTSAGIKAILKNIYTHTDKTLDEFAPDDVISKENVIKIMNDTY